MKHTNFIPISLHSQWKDPDLRSGIFLKNIQRCFLFSLVFMFSCSANMLFANNTNDDIIKEEACEDEIKYDLFTYNKSSNYLLTGTGNGGGAGAGGVVACNSHIYVSLNALCGAKITPAMLLKGVPDSCLTNFRVNILDGVRAGTDSVTIDYLGQKIRVECIDTTSTPQNKCWGYVTVEDKIAPVLTCRDTTVLCNTPTTPDVIGGQPTAGDACAGNVTFTYSDVSQSFNCKQGTGNTPDTISLIYRTWQGTDASGNSSTCTQTIYVVKPQLNRDSIIWPADSHLYCGDNPSTDPSTTGYPQIRYNGDTVSLDQFCLFGLNYQDQPFTTSDCIGTQKILRTWTVFDWCRRDSIYTNALVPGGQLIKIQDTIGPVITNLPHANNITVSFPDLNSCEATLTVPPITVSDACSPTDSIHVKVQVGLNTINTNGGVLKNVPFGTQAVIYTATDDCGNETKDTVMVTIEDNIAPTVICKENLVVALTQNGAAQVVAEAFNNGSYDNCSLDRIRVRRMDSCGVEMDLPFGEFVEFQCCDAGKDIMVQLGVWDTVGNFNSCMIVVQVQDKVVPVITCPPNLTVPCDTNLTDLSIFGSPVVSGGLCANTPLDSIETIDLNNCGVGTITRKWFIPDNTQADTCTQTITVTLVPNDSFNITRMPDSIMYVNCVSGIDIENLPENALEVESIGCQVLAVSYNQRVYNTTGECKEVLRTWEIIDWCRNPSATPGMPGHRIVTQIVKLIDTIAPIFTDTTREFRFSTDHGVCHTDVTLPNIAVTDSCGSTPTVRVNGIITKDGGVQDTLVNALPGAIFTNVTAGTYRLIYTASDGCNNHTSIPVDIIVEDTEGPSIFCDDVVTTLTFNGNAAPDSDTVGWITVWASDFNCKITDCNDNGIQQVIRFPSLGISQKTPPADTSFGWTFTCAHANTEQVGDLWVRDGAGNWDYVRVRLNIQDNMILCPDISLSRAMVSGSIRTEQGEDVEEVTVKVGGYTMNPEVTGIDGNYEFELPMHSNYTVAPEKNINPLNGVSTFDLVLISKHILGVQSLDSPYKHIAADVNRSGTITAFDLVQLRQLILNVTSEFSNNTSWRFVDANYQFSSENPAAESFTEIASIGNLENNIKADFVAVKIGDVNTNAVANRGLVTSESRTNGETLSFHTAERNFKEGETFTADFTLNNLETVEGYQFTLDVDASKLEIINIEEGVAQAGNFGMKMTQRGLLTTSWNQGATLEQNEERMFSVVLRAKATGSLSQAVSINSDLTSAEAYNTAGEIMNVNLKVAGGQESASAFTLHNNKPNPFKEATTISFELPEASTASLTIFDISGKVVRSIKQEFAKGYNEIQVEKANLRGSGIYFYQLETATHTAKKKMILIE